MGRFQGRYLELRDRDSDNLEARYEAEGFGYHSQYHYAPNPPDFQHGCENRETSTSFGRQYKPTALRWPFLITLLLALLSTLALLSYAITSLPLVKSNDISEHLKARGLYRPPALITSAGEDTESVTSDPAGTTLSSSDDESTTEFLPDQTRIPDHHGNVGTQTVTVSKEPGDASETPTRTLSQDLSGFGKTGTRTATVAYGSHNALPPDFFGKIGTVTVSAEPSETTSFVPTKALSDFSEVRTRTITKTLPVSTPTGGAGIMTSFVNLPHSDYGDIGSKTISEKHPESSTRIETMIRVTLGVATMTDEKGPVTTTSTETPPPMSSLETSTLTNSGGDATVTQVVTIMVTPSLTVETDSVGTPTAAIATYPIPPAVRTAVYSIDAPHYFVGKFLTTIVASILAIAVRILDTNAKSFQPWYALTHKQGASGRNSLCLDTGGWESFLMGLRSLAGGQAVVFLVSLLSLSSALLIPVSAFAITLDLRGDECKIGGSTASNCAYVLSVEPVVSRATLGILALMCLITMLLIVMLGRWRLGVYSNPWSICTLASLSANPHVRGLVLDAATGPDTKRGKSRLRHRDFKLDYFRGERGQMEYGIVALDHLGTGLSSMYHNEKSPLTSSCQDEEFLDRQHSPPFFMLGITGRLCLFMFLSGVLVLVLYYARTGGDTPFERFIDSDSFGVRFLFTALGVVITIFWSGFSGAVSVMNSYQFLSERPREAGESILLAPPSNAFSGLWHAVRTRRAFLGLVSLASILSESLSIFLGNVPFQVTQTFFVNQLCTWAAVGIMSFMLLMLFVSFFLKWPHMPVNPGSIAGAMYYVCDNSVIDKFEGLSTFDKKNRDRTVTGMGLLYDFSERMSIEGGSRVGLNVLDTKVFMP